MPSVPPTFASSPGPRYAEPPAPPPSSPPPSTSIPPKKGKRWVWWVVGALALLCLIALVVLAVVFGTKLLEDAGLVQPEPTAMLTPEPLTETPTLSPTLGLQPTSTPSVAQHVFGASVSITTPVTLAVGSTVDVTVTVVNTGTAPLLNVRYQLSGEWEPVLTLNSPAAFTYERLDAGQSHPMVFEFNANQAGSATLWVNVTADVLEPRRTEILASEPLTITVP